jgi:hypothetical protein
VVDLFDGEGHRDGMIVLERVVSLQLLVLSDACGRFWRDSLRTQD